MRALYANEEAAADADSLSKDLSGAPVDWPMTIGELPTWTFLGPRFSEETEETEASVEVEEDEEERGPAFRGPIAIEGHPTSDRRVLMSGEIDERAMPIPLNVQIQTHEGHQQSFNAGRIEQVEHIPITELDEDLIKEFGLDDLAENTVVIWGTGTFDTSEYAEEGQRMLANGAGISIDLSKGRAALLDPKTLAEVEDADKLSIEDRLFGDYLDGYAGRIGGATIVTMAAFEEASIKILPEGVLVASAYGLQVWKPFALVASAGPVKPPREWFQDPGLKELTPLTITKDGRVFGHLADWDGCHIGFQGVCVPPFRSRSGYAYFNNGQIETDDGELVDCGKIMFSRNGVGHADTDPSLTWQDVQRHYDDATCVGAFVRAGSDRFGTWLAGCLRSDLNDLEVQHMRTHLPSGDWRPIHPTDLDSELVAAIAVPVGGFAMARRALVASANGHVTAIISAPLMLDAEHGSRRRMRERLMLRDRMHEALGFEERTREDMRREIMQSDAILDEGGETVGYIYRD